MNEEHQSQSPQPTAGEAGVPKTAVAAVAADEEPFTEDLSANPERAGVGIPCRHMQVPPTQQQQHHQLELIHRMHMNWKSHQRYSWTNHLSVRRI